MGASTASATDWDDVQDEYRDYQRELRKGHFRHADREYREYCRKLAKYHRERFRGYYGPSVYASPAGYGTVPPAPAYGTTTYYYTQPYGYSQPTYYYHQPRVAVASGGVVIWR